MEKYTQYVEATNTMQNFIVFRIAVAVYYALDLEQANFNLIE